MFLMSTSIVLTVNSLTIVNRGGCWRDRWRRQSRSLLVLSDSSVGVISSGSRRRNRVGFIPRAKRNNHANKKKSWWRKFFFEEDGNWLGLKEDDMLEGEEFENSSKQAEGVEKEESEEDKFEAWKKRAEAIIELRETQDDLRNEENRNWEDWVFVCDETGNDNSNGAEDNWDVGNIMDEFKAKTGADVSEMMPERGLIETARDFVLGREDDDLLYEDRVFQYASRNSAKFLAAVIVIPWALDFIVHDYVLMPFLDRYVQTVPLAAELLDVRRNQKLEMVKELKVENARLRFEVEIGKSPPLSEEETWLEMRHKALELRDEWRLENRKAFANIWSDIVFGITVFVILYLNQSKVALLKFTGYKILNNISDTGKAFLIILVTDIFLGYHSESGWQTLCEIIVEHYGLEVDQSAITFFICLVPVIIDACVKLWLFKFLPRLSPKVANIFQEMKRH